MVTRIDAAALWSRALLVGSIAFFLGVWGHTSAEGRLPGPGLMVVLLTGTVLLTLPALARRASTPRMVGLLVGGQTAIHLCLTVTAGHRGDPAPAAAPRVVPAASGLPTVDGRRVGSLQEAYHGTADLAPSTPVLPIGHLVSDLQSHAPMMAAHLLAAAVVGLWLAYGERLLWTLVELAGRRLDTLVRPVLLVGVRVAERRTYVTAHAPAGPRSLWLARPHSRRGPPLHLLTAPAR